MLQVPTGGRVLHNQRKTEEGHDGARGGCEYPRSLLDGCAAGSEEGVGDDQEDEGNPKGRRRRQPRHVGEEGDHRGGGMAAT